ncbi:MAG: hypothetical protein M3Q79_04365 [bacterium]|nr:hypothetical protein [bacterium]
MSMPAPLRAKVSNNNFAIDILDNPSSASPASSGSGEAIIIAPTVTVTGLNVFLYIYVPILHIISTITSTHN